jgi:hypothetical protein
MEWALLVAMGNGGCEPMPIGDPGAGVDLLGGGAADATEGIAR